MADTERLGYSRGILEQLRTSHEQLSKEELLDLVCHLTKTYVLDATIPYDIPLPERAEELRADPPDAPPAPDEQNSSDPSELRFARLIEGLKRRTGLPQFAGFSSEGGRMILTVDNQRITFGDRVTIEFVPRAGAPAAPANAPTERRTPGVPEQDSAPPRPAANTRPGAPVARPEPPPPPPPPPKQEPEDDGYDPSVERFRRLDLD